MAVDLAGTTDEPTADRTMPGVPAAVMSTEAAPPPVVPRPLARRQERRQRSSRRRSYCVLVAMFVVSRVATALAGVRFDLWPLRQSVYPLAYPFQLLDPDLLQHHLVVSLWHLNSQPPLLNLFIGVLLHMPTALRQPVAASLFFALGLMMVLCAFATMIELRVPRWLAVAVCVLVIVDPAFILYENWLFYAYPTAAILTLSAFLVVRYAKTMDWRYGLGFFASITIVALLNSTYQLPWLVAAALVLVLAFRSHWRSVLTVAVVPGLLFVGWVAKDYAQVGSLTTSTWFGMNFSHPTFAAESPAEINSLVRSRVLTPIAEIPAFSPLAAYVPTYVALPRTGVAAVTETTIPVGSSNFNNTAYARVSDLYLHDDLAFIKARPSAYALNVVNSAKRWMIPSDEYFYLRNNGSKITGWTDLFDRTVLLTPASTTAISPLPLADQLSYSEFIIMAGVLIGALILAWRRRRSDPAWATTMGYLWIATAYAFLTTSLFELGENNRFSFEVGLIPVIAFVAVISECVRLWSPRRRVGA